MEDVRFSSEAPATSFAWSITGSGKRARIASSVVSVTIDVFEG